MILQKINIHSLRSIQEVSFYLNPEFTVFYGPNGSGKTSVLEAFHLLSTGYSFKTRENSSLVRHQDEHLTVFANMVNNETISLRKSISGTTQAKINGELCRSNSELSRFFPCQIIYQDIFQIIDAGPAVRRSLLDWGVFHVKHEYHSLWLEYRHVLKQRNALLRQKPSYQEMVPWNTQLVNLALQIDYLRVEYISNWKDAFQFYLRKLTNIDCFFEYFSGWRKLEKDLAQTLEDQFVSDIQRQYTQSGAHQADLRIRTSNSTAKKCLSRGQQKIILIALKLAQAKLLNQPCIYLFDDLTSELDTFHVKQVLKCLQEDVPGQKIITVLDLSSVKLLKADSISYFELHSA